MKIIYLTYRKFSHHFSFHSWMEVRKRQNHCQNYGLNQANIMLVNVLNQIQEYQISLGIHCPYATLVYDENLKKISKFHKIANKLKEN